MSRINGSYGFGTLFDPTVISLLCSKIATILIYLIVKSGKLTLVELT
jgi:hypothetical protein